MERILVINTGSTSTKIAMYEGKTQVFKENLEVSLESLAGVTRAVQQLPSRVKSVRDTMEKHGVDVGMLDMIVTRGGTLPFIRGGAYAVDEYMVKVAAYAALSQHESSLACMVGKALADPHNIPVIIYDAVSTNEANDVAQITGCPGVPASLGGHPLNSRIAARKVAQEIGISYTEGSFVVAHLGGSISVSAHHHGRIVDMVNAFSGPMSPQRAGRIPSDELLKLCYSGEYTYDELRRKLNGKSGFMGYFGTQDARAVFELARSGDEKADLIIRTMAYQVAKAMAEMRIAVGETPNALILTGGMAYATDFIELVVPMVEFMGPVKVLPGEMEMEALVEGARRVLQGKETAKAYDSIPRGYKTREQFETYVAEKEAEQK